MNTTIPPDAYPVITEGNNWLGTRIFGFEKCNEEGRSRRFVEQAYDEMHEIAATDGVYRNIPWRQAAASEYFGTLLYPEVEPQIQGEFYPSARLEGCS